MKQQPLGFTLIELIIVIVLLGILSAVALPRFMNLSDEAYLATTKGAAAAFLEALKVAQAKHIINPSLADFNGDGTSDLIFSTGYKFPTGAYVPVGVPIDFRAGGGGTACAVMWDTLFEANGLIVSASQTAIPAPDFWVMGQNSSTPCLFMQMPPHKPGDGAVTTNAIIYNPEEGSVSVVTNYSTYMF